MMGPDRDVLARDYSSQPARVSDLPGLPEFDESSLLDRFLSRLCEHIKNEGLTSLYWVSGIHTQEIQASLLEGMAQQLAATEFAGDKFCIVIKPTDEQLLDTFGRQSGISVRNMAEFYVDSFIIVNEKAVLDVTPVATDDGDPEYNEDPTVVSLYIGLFNMLKNGTTPL